MKPMWKNKKLQFLEWPHEYCSKSKSSKLCAWFGNYFNYIKAKVMPNYENGGFE